MFVSTQSLRSATVVERWSLVNAVGVLTAAGMAGLAGSIWPLVIGGSALLVGFAFVARDRWTPRGDFGSANAITALRVGLLGLLPPAYAMSPTLLIGLSLLILVTDALDGWFARRGRLESEFGAFFDKETDALFLLVLCGIAAFRGRLSDWIIAAGLLRYGFVVLLFLLPSPAKTEQRSRGARYVYGGMIVALLASFLPYPAVYNPLVALASGALVLSFGRSLWRLSSR